jgi:hypothetical protein
LTEGILHINTSLKLNPYHPSSWLILAIMLFLRSDPEQAKQACDMGIKECVKEVKQKDLVSKKIDFIRLHLLKLDVEVCLYGPKIGMEYMQTIFALHKRLFQQSKTSSTPNLKENNSSQRQENTVSFTSENSMIAALILGYLWVKSASLYREMNQFSMAKTALMEAEKSLDILTLPAEKFVYKIPKSTVDESIETKWFKYSHEVRRFVSDLLYEVRISMSYFS